jgi:long-chain acyl-CoA synthetase
VQVTNRASAPILFTVPKLADKDLLQAPQRAWLKSYERGVEPDPEFPEKPLYALLDEAAELYGPRPCVEFKGRVYTYANIKGLSDRLAKGLVQAGFKPGMKLGLFLPNCPFFVAFYFAGLKAGGTIVNFNPLYAEEELVRQILDSGSDFMVTLDLAVLLGKFADVFERTKLQRLVVCSLAEQLPVFKSYLFRATKRKDIASLPTGPRYLSSRELLHNDGKYQPVAVNPKVDIAVLQYTGGTTGISKGAALTHFNLYANTMQCKAWFRIADSPDSKSVGIIPLCHAFAMTAVMNWSIAVGGSMLLEPRLDVTKLLALISKRKPNIFIGVPTLYTALLSHPDFDRYDLSSIKFAIAGGAPLPLALAGEFKRRTGITIWEGYGLSEASPVACINPVHVANRTGSVGLPLPGTLCEIVSIEDHKSLMKPGERGEICLRGPQIMQGYWHKPEATAEALRDGRLHTGDIGHMDQDGYVFITDRLKEMIMVSGYKVYPRHVEEAIYQHPSVKECAAYGIDDSYRGQAVRAAVCLKDGASLAKEQLDQFLESRLSHIEKPVSYDFRIELPKTVVGKINKKALSDEYRAARKEKVA